jgi:glycosyltransferase involved in cell wall biosynthesis
MITFGHQDFIVQAIEGVLNQICSYDIELILCNDNSPDSSDILIKNLIENNPKGHLIKYFNHKENIGMMPNFLFSLKKAKGDYIALCEGDDFWTDSNKLQKQVDFLEANPSFSTCFHKVSIVYENGIAPFLEEINENTAEVTTLQNLLSGNYIHTPSVVFRNHNDYPDWLLNCYPGDWPLHIINATYGKIYFMKEYMAGYRVHYGGVHSTTEANVEKSLNTFDNICIELEKRNFNEEAKLARAHFSNAYAILYGLKGGQLLHLNRLEKSILILKKGNFKHKFLFWLPLFFNENAYSIYLMIMRKNKKYLHS